MSARSPLFLAWLALAPGCSGGETPAPAAAPAAAREAPAPPPAVGRLERPPTIVLISIDTLRREHLSCYGYFRPTTPHIDALARESLVFERALASSASTLPSHLTMLTGIYPHQHGMTSNLRGASTPFVSELGRLSAAVELQARGYRTGAFVSAVPLSEWTGIGAGFDTFVSPTAGGEYRPSWRAEETNRHVLAWLGEQAANAPLFLFVHYFDPHEPNDPPPPYAGLFQTDAAQLEWIRARGIEAGQLNAKLRKTKRLKRHFFPELRSARGREADALRIEQVAELMNRYDGEVRLVDDAVGALLARLRELGLWDQAIVVLTADHGQSLGENVWFGHGTISEVNTLVPWLLRLPPGLAEPARVDALVSLADLMPTLLGRFELPGLELLRGQFEGEDVLSGAFARPHVLVTRSEDPIQGDTRRQYALVSGRWKLLHRPEEADQLFDLRGAGESSDVLAQNPAIAAELRATLLALLARRPALLEPGAPAAEPNAELLEGLRELGYAGDE